MIDPITAVATATAAFNTIKSGFQMGRDVEGMAAPHVACASEAADHFVGYHQDVVFS